MGLQSVLVDRGRILRQAVAAGQVGGRTQFVKTEPGQWFDCRLFLPQMPESFDSQRVSKRVVIVPTLLYGIYDQDGNLFRVLPTDYLEIESDDLDSETWQVTAEPQPLRKKRGVIGFQTSLKRVEVSLFASSG